MGFHGGDRQAASGEPRKEVREKEPIDIGVLLPTLTRFYPGVPWRDWTGGMPQDLLSAYMEMIPVLTAQESLRRYEENVFGSGNYAKREEYHVKNTIRAWKKDANRFVRRSRNVTAGEAKSKLASIGIPIITVPRKKKCR